MREAACVTEDGSFIICVTICRAEYVTCWDVSASDAGALREHVERRFPLADVHGSNDVVVAMTVTAPAAAPTATAEVSAVDGETSELFDLNDSESDERSPSTM